MKIQIERHPGTPDNVDTAKIETYGDDQLTGRPTTIDIVPESASRVVVREVFNGLTAITADGETIAFTMRDSGFEIAYQCGETIVHVDLQRGEVHHSDHQSAALLGYATNRHLIEELRARWSMGSTHPDYSTMTSDKFDTDEYTTGEFTVAATPAPRRLDDHRAMDMLEMAWTIIANGNGGNWETADPVWRMAAERWRDGYHDILDGWVRNPEEPATIGEVDPLQADNDGPPTTSPGGWPAPPVDGPHSRACGITPHPHGQQCSTDCPTCDGKPIAWASP